VPKDAKVYEVGETAPEGVAVPLSVSDYGISGKLRYYEATIEGGKFTPNTFSCYVGDLLKIKFTAVDKDYDIVIPDRNMGFPLLLLYHRNNKIQSTKFKIQNNIEAPSTKSKSFEFFIVILSASEESLG